MGEGIVTVSLEVAGLTALMRVTTGISKVAIGLVDGPVAADHPDLATENIRSLTAATDPATPNNGVALSHGTYVAGILAARRGSSAPAVCPGCTLLVRPIFLETVSDNAEMPSATPDEVADAIA
ncbi:MAG: S8 family serine peptidase, partial [Rhodoplanes sp.]